LGSVGGESRLPDGADGQGVQGSQLLAIILVLFSALLGSGSAPFFTPIPAARHYEKDLAYE
jgi:hypothetical protein